MYFYKQSDLIAIPVDLESKILSGKLIHNISEKKYLYLNGPQIEGQPKEIVVIYFEKYPSGDHITSLEALNIQCFLESWTPPLPIIHMDLFWQKCLPIS